MISNHIMIILSSILSLQLISKTQSTFDCVNLVKLSDGESSLTVSNYCLKCSDVPKLLRNIKLKVPEVFCEDSDLKDDDVIKISPSDSLSIMVKKIPEGSKKCCFHSNVKEDQETLTLLEDMKEPIHCSCKKIKKIKPTDLLKGMKENTVIMDVEPIPTLEPLELSNTNCCVCQDFSGLARTACGIFMMVMLGVLTPVLLT